MFFFISYKLYGIHNFYIEILIPENNFMIKQMEEMVTKYEMKEKITLKQLNERLDILGDNKTVEQLVNQTKSIHAQV